MKLPKIKIKPETAVTVGLAALGIAQAVLTNKKEASDRAAMKAEILEEVMKNNPVEKD